MYDIGLTLIFNLLGLVLSTYIAVSSKCYYKTGPSDVGDMTKLGHANFISVVDFSICFYMCYYICEAKPQPPPPKKTNKNKNKQKQQTNKQKHLWCPSTEKTTQHAHLNSPMSV